MADFKRPLDYIDVAQRLREMREKYPDLSMQQVDMKFMNVGNKDWVVYTAAAYRTPDDPRPGIGTAWEPIPGPTNFTRDSEVQNAETAAWGRALVAIGADTKAGIASVEEITNRTGEAPQRPQTRPQAPFTPPTDGEVSEDINVIMKAAEQSGDEFLSSLAQQYMEKGRLSEKQIGAGVTKAMKILSAPRSMPEYDYAPEDERFA